MQIFDIVSAEKYSKNGEEKTSWNQIGKLFTKDDGGQFIKLHMFPNQIFSVFEQKKREGQE